MSPLSLNRALGWFRRDITANSNAWTILIHSLALLLSLTDRYGKSRLLWALIFVAAGAVTAALNPIALQIAVDVLVSNDGRPHSAPFLLVGLYVVGQYLSRTFVELRLLTFGEADQRVRRRVSGSLFDHIVRLPMRSHLNRKAGEVAETAEQGITGYQLLLTHLVYTVFPVTVEFIVVAVVLLHFAHPEYLAILGASALAYVWVFSRGTIGIRTPAQSASRAHIEASGVLMDALVNSETIKYFAAEPALTGRYDGALGKTEMAWRLFFRRRAVTGLTVAVIFGVSLAWSLFMAITDVVQGTMTVGEFVLVNAYVVRLVQPLDMLAMAIRDITQGVAFLEKMLELFDEEPEADRSSGQRFAGYPEQGSLSFENVSFTYSHGREVLSDISFSVAPGRTLAVVGVSGSGKSSLGRLLFRLYEPDAGRILLDGQPIRDMPLSVVRDAIAIVPQDTVLFHDTIARNIAVARPGSSQGEIEEAARIAHLHEFIARFPEGYDTIVGERGLRLSGGERQRVAIARAALKKPRVFVFDELSSSLDASTEKEILRNLVEVSRGTTTIVIAHRLATIVDAHEIIVLNDGAIVERGSHRALIERDGSYAALWLAQQREITGKESSSVAA